MTLPPRQVRPSLASSPRTASLYESSVLACDADVAAHLRNNDDHHHRDDDTCYPNVSLGVYNMLLTQRRSLYPPPNPSKALPPFSKCAHIPASRPDIIFRDDDSQWDCRRSSSSARSRGPLARRIIKCIRV